MINLAAEHLRRLESLLATARADYDMLDYIVLEGPVQVTYHSLNRTVVVPISGDDVGHISGMLAETLLNRIAALEKEIVEGHAQVVAAADDQLVDQLELATYRQQKRATPALQADSAPAEASQPLTLDEYPP
ncbi:hypothetical protein GCM10023172_23090 [Hymenobacter ginsengisoli]|uniref:Uncharacterized protein n=1 Tax=Hymenobacter ginsengisoli TaxID=1051626 RepID=A0ABP8QDU9_9BACT|nr:MULTISPECIES: hypothetical protein [unclassified Hymenobacter]MBO2031927.1 hypothetical protein [Hymenobacter sp. BT559]